MPVHGGASCHVPGPELLMVNWKLVSFILVLVPIRSLFRVLVMVCAI